MEGKEVKCPRCGKSVYRKTTTAASTMSGLSCSPCKIHFDIKVERGGSYKVIAIR